MENNKQKGLASLFITFVVLVFLGFLAYNVLTGGNSKSADSLAQSTETAVTKLGLDLADGVSITYQTVDPNPSDEDMADTIYKLQQRVQNYSTEAEVYREGDNRINIDIPGVSDANAILDELGKPGSLIFVDPQGNTVLTGDQVATAKAGIIDNNGNSEYVVSLTFTEEGSKAFAEATARLIGQRIAIMYDNIIYSNPTVQTAITGGTAQITGMTSYDEAEKLASNIRIGSLSLELEELRSQRWKRKL